MGILSPSSHAEAFVLGGMLKKILDNKNEQYDCKRWSELEALAKGGKRFHSLITKFLPQNPFEPSERYRMRTERARYYSYMGAIINLYAGWLFAAGFTTEAHKGGTTSPVASIDSWYGKFNKKASGKQNIEDFLKERFRTAMTMGKAYWLAELPAQPEDVTVTDAAMFAELGLGNAQLTDIDPRAVLDWKCDSEGNFEWVVVKDEHCHRSSWETPEPTYVQEWRIYDRDVLRTFRIEYARDKPPRDDTDIPMVSETPHGFKRVPIVAMSLPEELAIGEQTYDAQLSHFQHDAALSWAIIASCYPMLVFHITDTEKKPAVGAGYGIYMGAEEKVSWIAPPAQSFDVIAKNRDDKRDEIFRIVHQMAQGLDNNAETVGRSADSKEIDAVATRIMLDTYGDLVKGSIVETFKLISEARGDDYDWCVVGLSGYDTTTVHSLLANLERAKMFGIPSQTFQREAAKKGALALMGEVDPAVKNAIRHEIDEFEFALSGDIQAVQLQKENLTAQIEMNALRMDTQQSIAEKNASRPVQAPTQPPKT